MGATTENVLVRLSGAGAIERLTDAVRQAVGTEFEALPDGAKADRTVVVWAPAESAWTTVSDSHFDEAGKLAGALSRQSGAPAVAVRVFDSDEAWFRLYRNGKLSDTLTLRGKTPRLRKERWADVLEPPGAAADLVEGLSGETVFVEERVARAARLLGADPAQCLSRADEIDESHGALLRLGFRSKLLPQMREAQGPPSFEVHDRFAGIEAGAGDVLQQVSLSVRNRGGESQGVEIRLEGDAVEQGLLEAQSVTLVRFVGPQQPERVEVPFELGTARAEAAVIPAGPPAVSPEALGKMLMADPALFTQGKLWLNLGIRADQPGSGTLRVRVRPLANPEGEAVWEAPVRVTAAIRKPLRSTEKGSLYARKLVTPSTLVGLAILAGGDAAAADFAAKAIRAWVDAVGPSEGRWRLHWNMHQLGAPRDTLIAGTKPAGDKAWMKVFGKLPEHDSVWAPRRPDKEEREQDAGFLFDRTAAQPGLATASPAPHLGFWADLRGVDAARRAQLQARLTEIIDATAAQAELLQGFLACWDAPDGLTAGHTLYELACGIVGQGVQGVPWCERWLRAAAETLWLGPSLCDRVGQLDAVARIEEAGSARKLTLRDGASFDQLEAELAPILPSAQDWQSAVRGFYGRG